MVGLKILHASHKFDKDIQCEFYREAIKAWRIIFHSYVPKNMLDIKRDWIYENVLLKDDDGRIFKSVLCIFVFLTWIWTTPNLLGWWFKSRLGTSICISLISISDIWLLELLSHFFQKMSLFWLWSVKFESFKKTLFESILPAQSEFLHQGLGWIFWRVSIFGPTSVKRGPFWVKKSSLWTQIPG